MSDWHRDHATFTIPEGDDPPVQVGDRVRITRVDSPHTRRGATGVFEGRITRVFRENGDTYATGHVAPGTLLGVGLDFGDRSTWLAICERATSFARVTIHRLS